MADFVCLPKEGFHFSTPEFPNAVIKWIDVPQLGQALVIGVAPVGEIGYTTAKMLWGPAWLDSTQQAGTFLAQTMLSGAASAAIADLRKTAKEMPAVAGDAPATEQNLNTALGQYFALDANCGVIQVEFPLEATRA